VLIKARFGQISGKGHRASDEEHTSVIAQAILTSLKTHPNKGTKSIVRRKFRTLVIRFAVIPRE